MPRPSFPKSFLEFTRRFQTEDDCFDYIIASRWPDGFVCEQCGSTRAWKRKDKRAIQCAQCNKVYSATAGTVMNRSKQPLCTWLWAAYLVATDKRGISAMQFQRQLGIKRYETAFNMLHKLRAAMVNPERDLLYGTVEVDETYIGGKEPGKRGRGAAGKALVVGAVELRNGRPARIRLRKIDSASSNNLMKFITENVAKGPDNDKTVVITDGSPAYNALYEKGYIQRIQSTNMLGDDPDTVLPHFHLAISNLKTWILGTHHGAISEKHLQAYLNEFAFRYNRRGNLQAAFQTLLGLTPKSKGPTYKGLYKGTFTHRNPPRRRKAA